MAVTVGGKRGYAGGGGFWRATLVYMAAVALSPVPLHAEDPGRITGSRQDTALYRAMHSAMLGVTHAGDRLVVVGERASVLLSDDDGLTWRLGQAPGSALLTAVMFINPREGYAVGQDETILKTSDGGESWVVQFAKDKADRPLLSLTRMADGSLVAAGADGLALTSSDGQHWIAMTGPDLDWADHLNCVTGAGDDVLIGGAGGHDFVLHHGAWVAASVPLPLSQFGCLSGKDGAVYSFGLNGSLFRGHLPQILSGDLSPSWSRIDTGTENTLFGGAVLDDGKLALVGEDGLFLLIDPAAGDKVKIMPAETEATLSAVLPLGDGGFMLAGSQGISRLQLNDAAGAAGRTP